jgi:hypothetical protein
MLNDCTSDNDLQLDGYTLFRRDRPGNGGGICVYARNELSPESRPELYHPDLELLWLSIKPGKGKRRMLICCLYRPPNAATSYYDSILENFNMVVGKPDPCVILGDFNININPNGITIDHRVEEICNLFNLSQLINVPTRETCNTSTCIDHIYTTQPDHHFESGVLKYTLSDHYFIYTKYKLNYKTPKPVKYTTRRNYKSFLKDNFLHDLDLALSKTDIFSLTDVDAIWHTFKKLFLSISEKHAPLRRYRVGSSTCPWLGDDIKRMMRLRDRTHAQACDTKSETKYRQYRNLRNQVTNALRQSKRDFFHESIIRSAGNKRAMWRTVNMALKTKTTDYIPSSLNANEVNEFFATLGSDLISDKTCKLPATNFPKHSRQFLFKHISNKSVNDELKTLPSSSNLDLLNMDRLLLKLSADIISPVISHLINTSLDSSVVPIELKQMKVSPIYKGKGPKNELINYRPIAITAHLAKILEKSVNKQLHQYLSSNEFLTTHQSAYLKGHSTITSLQKVTSDWYKAIDDKQLVCVAYFDIAKCFNSIDHTILRYKLQGYGIKDKELAWFTSYLNNRYQTVNINGNKSKLHAVKLGIPQGSVLGPLLFLLYLNDLPSVTKCSINLYADDTCLYICDSDPQKLKSNLQTEADKIYKWFTDNRLTLNVNKSNLMYIGTQQRLNCFPDLPTVSVNGTELEIVKSVKYLGMHIDQNISWKSHISDLGTKLRPKLGALSRLSHTLPSYYLNTIYNTTIQPHIDYGLPIWGHTFTSYIDSIQRYQNRAARIVTKQFNYDTSVSGLHKQLRWLNIPQRAQYLSNLFVHKICYGQSPSYLHKMITPRSTISQRETRQSQDLLVPLPHTEMFKRSLTYQAPYLWNKLPQNIRNTEDRSSFKRLVKDFIMS